jgi:predicted nucleic acid-binding protein
VIALDASVLIAHLNPDDAHHAAATELLLGASPGSMLVHALTMAEVFVGGVRVGRGAAMRDDLHAAGIDVAPHDPDEPPRLAELRASSGLKLPDCCALDVALHRNASLATFDRALSDAAQRRGFPVIPQPTRWRLRANGHLLLVAFTVCELER